MQITTQAHACVITANIERGNVVERIVEVKEPMPDLLGIYQAAKNPPPPPEPPAANDTTAADGTNAQAAETSTDTAADSAGLSGTPTQP